MYTTAFPCLMCAGAIVKLGIPKVVYGAAWKGCESSESFLLAHGVELVDLNLAECHDLVRVG